MKIRMKLLSTFVMLTLLVSAPAFADNYTTVPHPNAVWDSTTSTLYGLGIPGKGPNGLTVIPSGSTTNSWSGVNTFTNGVLVLTGNVGIGTTNASGAPLVIVGLGTAAPIGTSAAGSLCIDSANNVYRKATCP